MNPTDTELCHCMTPETMRAFLAYETEKGASENMIRRFKGAVQAVYAFLPEDKLLTKAQLLAWRRSMEENHYASPTILNYVKYINRYLNYVGCSAIRFHRGKAKDIANKTFGYLTAIEPIGAKNRGDIVWLCQCQCGNTVELPATRLLLGNTLSCGCLQQKHRKEVFLKANKTYAGTNLAQAIREQTVSTRNISGYVGVFPKRDKWMATLRYRGKQYYLGTFCDMEDAVKARARAKELAIEDAKGLLDFYEELHKSDPVLPGKHNRERYEFTSHGQTEKHEKPVSAAKRTNNTSGCVGVTFCHNRWEARIGYQGVRYLLGRFADKQEAVSARETAEALLQTDPDRFFQAYSKAYAYTSCG